MADSGKRDLGEANRPEAQAFPGGDSNGRLHRAPAPGQVEQDSPGLPAARSLCGLVFIQIFLLTIRSPASEYISLFLSWSPSVSFLSTKDSPSQQIIFPILAFYLEILLNLQESFKKSAKNIIFP